MADPGAALAPDLRKRIEIMADHIARNGADFETTVKQKNASNPQFSFLYNGEGAEYYQQASASNRLRTVLENKMESNEGARCPCTADSGGPRGLTPLTATDVQGAPPVELADVLRRWKEPQVLALTPEVERQLHGVIASLEHMASRDAIKSGRLWIECNSALAPHIAGHIMLRVSFLSTCSHRLHVLYLVHDLLQTEAARKDLHAPLVRAFKPYLPWILRPCYQLALTAQGEETSRVLRLVQLWVDRGILSAQEAEEVKAVTMTQELPGVQASSTRPLAPHAPMGMPGSAPLPTGALRPPPAAPCMPFAGAAMSVPMLHGYQKQILAGLQHTGVQTPETVPVGVLASMLASVANHPSGKHVRYRPLDPAMTPQALPAMEVPTPHLLAKVEEFYEDLQDEDRGSSSSSNSSSRSRSREPERREARMGFGAMSAMPPPVF
ncbi:Cherp [Symbiodinium natans]|uniref:Cherp protein n=1 Tax=Symbiodinium natans TaxID=878477 RepID=A0A812RN08_9DINO|nr:Cherp [Symbiodinium natans]